MMNKKLILTAVGLLLFITACGIFGKGKSGKYSINKSYMDLSVSPKEDFFMFSNGKWVKNNPVPDSESRWGSFNELDEQNKIKLKKILSDAMKQKDITKGSTAQLIGDFYAAYLDTVTRASTQHDFIYQLQEKVYGMRSVQDLPQLLAYFHNLGIPAFFTLYVGQDLKDVNKQVAYLSQSGLGLPNKNYYDEDDEKMIDIQEAYKEYLTDLANIMGVEAAEKIGLATFEVEKSMARHMMAPAEMRSPEKTYNPMPIEKVYEMNNSFSWKDYFNALEVGEMDQVIIRQTKYFMSLDRFFDDGNFEMLRLYLVSKIMNHYAPHAGMKAVKRNFDFYGGVLSGKKSMKPIEEIGIEHMTSFAVKEALGKAFVEAHFSEKAKQKVNEMVDNLLSVYEERINKLEWMTEMTKNEALIKLKSIGRKLGYPDEWKDLSALKISKNSHLSNVDACNTFAKRENLNKLGKPVNRNEWSMPAHMVNAYYHPVLNEIAFPAGIMQPPFFDLKAEDAVNYGGIGMVIGHEFTHGFDDMGSKFAADGSLSNWWTEEDRTNFESRTKKLGKTFESFCPVDGHCINPELTMGENIADLGGVTMAYYAYSLTKEFKSGKEVNGFTPAQRFFIAYAQLWKINYTEAELKKRIATDPHSPGMYRVNGPLMNSPEFFEAFNVKEGDPMRNSEEEISRIW